MKAIGVTINKQEDGDTLARVPIIHNDEIGRLANAFNQMLDALIERDRRFRTVVDHLPVAVTLRDIKGDYHIRNRQFNEWFENRGSDKMDPRRAESSPGNIQLIRERTEKENQVITTGREITFEEKHSNPDSGTRWFVTTLFPVQDVNGELTATGAASTDISERKLAEKHIEHLAYYDSLTQIPNRSLFRDRMEQSLKQARRNRKQVGLFYLDLDGFKTVNDTFGHRIGDRLLILAAKRLRENVREQDTVARMGGDEFTLIIGDVDSLNAGKVVTDIAEKIKTAVAEPFNVDDHEIYVSTSIGIALYPKDGDQVDELLKRADMAMYQSKSLGHNNHKFFSRDMNSTARKRQCVEEQLKRALDKNEFSVYYQPQIDMRTGDLAGVEALLRWTNSKLGDIPPTDFISVAEDTGLIEPIGEWVLRRACEQLQTWREEGFALPRVAVNMSPRQLKRKDLPQTIEHILNDTKLTPSCLELEVTERVLIQNPVIAASVLNDLKMLDVGLAMDDFGTGYSSLSHLRQIPFDTVKIDRSFIRDIPYNQKDSEFITAIIALARGLNLTVIAEGIETMEQWNFLRSLHCDRIQGTLTGMPMPADKVQVTYIKGSKYLLAPSRQVWGTSRSPTEKDLLS